MILPDLHPISETAAAHKADDTGSHAATRALNPLVSILQHKLWAEGFK